MPFPDRTNERPAAEELGAGDDAHAAKEVEPRAEQRGHGTLDRVERERASPDRAVPEIRALSLNAIVSGSERGKSPSRKSPPVPSVALPP
jgi:hypothetical protein